MTKKIYIARPRLDCSFKPGPIPDKEGIPKNHVLTVFSRFLDNLEIYHRRLNHEVLVEKRALWQFELAQMQEYAQIFDTVYFAHRLQTQFPIGANALYFKTTAFPEYVTVDSNGWGASLSWLPISLQINADALVFFNQLRQRIEDNISVFNQPPLSKTVGIKNYLFFPCQLPHDETIKFHSSVSVEEALSVVIAYAQEVGKPLVVKGHPANPKSMLPLKAMVEASKTAYWVEDISIHTCLADAERVFTVNSGVGFEAMLHDKTIIHFGHAEYSSIVPRAECTINSLIELEKYRHSTEIYAGFLNAFFQRTIRFDDLTSFERVLNK